MSSKVLVQFEFLKNVAQLIYFADQQGIVLTGGDLWRSHSQMLLNYHGKQVIEKKGDLILIDAGKTSKTMRSKHPERLAIDFNFFIKGVLTYRKKDIQVLGDYWEALHPKNKWGGNWENFVDVPHFQRSL